MTDTVDVTGSVLADGSWLILLDTPKDEEAHPAGTTTPTDGVLSGEFLQLFGEAVAAGVSYEMLKAAAVQIARKTGLIRDAADAESICRTVTEFLLRVGHTDVTVTDVLQVPEHGWRVQGTVDGQAFVATSDETGRVTHLRIT